MRVPKPLRGISPLLLLVLVVDGIGAAAASAVWLGDDGASPPLTVPWLGGWALIATLLVGTALGELVSVKIRRGDSVEELAFLEAAVVLAALLLPARTALCVVFAALVAVVVVRRRSPLKAAFNLGAHATATAAAMSVMGLTLGTTVGFGWRLVLALLLGTAAYNAVNTLSLAAVMGVTGARPAGQFVRDEVRMSAVMAVGTCALAGITLALAVDGPAMLPFALMPAAALMFAYRAASQEAQERTRAGSLLAVSRLLAAGGDVLPAFLRSVRGAFDVTSAVVVLEQPRQALAAGADGGVSAVDLPPAALLAGRDPAIVEAGLPPGWARVITAPLEADGRRLGVLLLVSAAAGGPASSTANRGRLDARALTLATSLASALAAALRSAEHLDRLVAERTKLAAVVDQSSDGILVLDGAGIVQLWSPALEGITGVSAGEAVGQPVVGVLPLRREGGDPLDAELTPARPRQVFTAAYERADGEPRWLRLSHSAAFGDRGELVLDVVLVHDLTRSRRVDRLKTDFIATVSHELRTPLTPIAGYVDLLRTRGERVPPAKRAAILDLLADRTAHLARLVEDLLLASRIDGSGDSPAQGVTMGVHDLASLTSCVVTELGATRVRLDVPAMPTPVAGDDVRIVQVVSNLVSNALKYSAADAPVDVAVRRSANRVVVAVTDRGLGIPAEELEQVFEKFHRVEDALTMSTSGSGLGLFIARHLSRAMGGDVTVESVFGVGSTFSLTLRPAEAELPAPRAGTDPRHTVGR